MHNNDHPRCNTCPYYLSKGDGQFLTATIPNSGGATKGECRAKPPVEGHYNRFPVVYSIDYCGAHPDAPLTKVERLLSAIVDRLGGSDRAA